MPRTLPLAFHPVTICGPNGERAELRRTGRVWAMLWKSASGDVRERWGNAQEIRADCDEFERTGTVARERGGWA